MAQSLSLFLSPFRILFLLFLPSSALFSPNEPYISQDTAETSSGICGGIVEFSLLFRRRSCHSFLYLLLRKIRMSKFKLKNVISCLPKPRRSDCRFIMERLPSFKMKSCVPKKVDQWGPFFFIPQATFFHPFFSLLMTSSISFMPRSSFLISSSK